MTTQLKVIVFPTSDYLQFDPKESKHRERYGEEKRVISWSYDGVLGITGSYLESLLANLLTSKEMDVVLQNITAKPKDINAILWTNCDIKAILWTNCDIKAILWTNCDIKAILWTNCDIKAILWTNCDIKAILWTNCDIKAILWTNCDIKAILWTNCDIKAILWTNCDIKAILWTNCDIKAILWTDCNFELSVTKIYALNYELTETYSADN